MSNIAKPEFALLDISGNNYLSWILDVELYLQSKGLADTIRDNNETSLQDKATAMIFIRRHLHESLKTQYLTIRDPLTLWKNLKDRYDHQKTVVLPRARHEWSNLRLQDFKSVADYNSALFKITSQLNLCGEILTDADLLEKTYTTFHASNVLLQQQYRERRFTKYSELISCLLVAEQNNEFLMKNHELRPAGAVALPEANASTSKDRGRGHGRERGNHGRGGYKFSSNRNQKNISQKWNVYNAKHNKGKNVEKHTPKHYEDVCFRCGMSGHWSRTCRTTKHLVDLYQASVKGKEKKIDTNFADQGDDPEDITSLDLSDFLDNADEKVDYSIGDGDIHTN